MGSNRAEPKDLPSPKKSTQTAKTSAPKKPTGFQQMGAGTQTPAGISNLLKPFQINPSATNKTGGGLDLGQQPKKSSPNLSSARIAGNLSSLSNPLSPAGDANNIKSMLFQQMDIADKTDKSFDAQKLLLNNLKLLKNFKKTHSLLQLPKSTKGFLKSTNGLKVIQKLKHSYNKN